VDPLQRRLTDEVRPVEPAVAAQPAFEGIVLSCHVGAVRQEPAFDPLDQIGASGADVEVRAGLPKGVPERAGERRRIEVDLKAALLAPARARNQQRMSLEGRAREAEKSDRPHLLAEHPSHEVFGLGALHGKRVNLRLVDLDVQAHTERQSLGPEQHVGVGDGNPVPVLGQLEQHGIVDHAAALIDQRGIDALSYHGTAQVARCHQLEQPGRVRPAQLDLAFAADIPDLHMAAQVPVVLFERAECRGQERVVIDRVGFDTLGLDPFGEGGRAGPAGNS
jgi:hypothetical protein